jgi:hypothetical protein
VTTTSTASRRRPGRPLKFGRPARLVSLSLPDDVLRWLRTLHADPAWAIVALFRQNQGRRAKRLSGNDSGVAAELVSLSGGRALIVVNPRQLGKLKGVSMIPMSDGRALLALDPLKGLADLELAVADRLEHRRLDRSERRSLEAFHRQLRGWRRTPGVRFTNRAIIVAQANGRR